MKTYKNRKNNNNIESNSSLYSNNKRSNNIQEIFLNKFHKICGDSFNDIELLDIFSKNNYDDKLIMEDIKALLSIGNEKSNDKYNNNYNNYEEKIQRDKINTYDKRSLKKFVKNYNDDNFTLLKKEENSDENKNENILGEMVDLKDKLLIKKNIFKKIKDASNSYKPNKNKNDEINFDLILNKEKDYEKLGIGSFITQNNNYKIDNNYSPEFKSNKKNEINENVKRNNNEALKKKYFRTLCENMKKYSINPKTRDNSSDINMNRKQNILNTSPDKIEFFDRRILTYKKGFKNYYSKENNILLKKIRNLKIQNKVSDIFIPSCYDNPLREQYLKIVNEKKKENSDKIIEFLIPQYPIYPPIHQPYQNIYTQYNPYNMYMMPPMTSYSQYSYNMNNNNINNIPDNYNNNIINNNRNDKNKVNNNENDETPGNQNNLTPNQIMQLNNNNQMNIQINDTPNPNALLFNNNENSNTKINEPSNNINSKGNNNK